MRKDIAAAAVAALVAGSSCTVAQATTIGYYMDMSNIAGFPAGNYAKVLISDINPTTHVSDGSIYFDVTTTPFFSTAPLSEGTNFGMQDFSFNFDNSLSVGTGNLNLISPSGGWSVTANQNAGGGYGFFDLQYSGSGSSRTTDLQFSISGIGGDSPSSYAVANSNGYYFATHITDFNWAGSTVTSGQFSSDGSTLVPPSEVPIPAAVWLFGSGLVGLAGFARRRART